MKRFFLVLCCGVILFSGCGKKAEDNAKDTIVNTDNVEKEETEQKEVVDQHIGQEKSILTGLWIDEKIAEKRPVAITINNLHKALPQSGLEKADIYYETLAEGEITRIVAIFQDYMADKIGPVRSARDYFTYFALDNDAIYVHHGGSPTGYSSIKKRGVNDIDGMNDTTAFFRDKKRLSQPGMYEHSSFITGEGLSKSIENRNFRNELDTSYEPMFLFNEEDNDISGEKADDIIIPYSYYQVSEFKYDDVNKVYERIQSGTPQIDELTGNTLSVKNVILQYADMYVIAGDEAGRRDVSLVGSGKGHMITNGNMQEITWEKANYSSPTNWYDSEGNKLTLNSGKTWVCVYPNGKDDITFTSVVE